MSPVDLIVFDFDGTLVDSWRDIATAVNRTLRAAGVAEVAGADVKGWVGNGVLALLRRAVGDATGEALYPSFRRHYAACCLDTTRLYDGVSEALDRLAAMPLAILSNKPELFLDKIVDGLGIRHRFVAVVGGDALPVSKPDPATLAHVVACAGPARRVWMVGDSDVDINTGRAYGARTVGCSWGLRPIEELQRAGADVIVDHPSQLPAALVG